MILDYEIELVVLKDVPRGDAPFVDPLMLWLELVIKTAYYNRHDVCVRHFFL